jgi:hypothetical protein
MPRRLQALLRVPWLTDLLIGPAPPKALARRVGWRMTAAGIRPGLSRWGTACWLACSPNGVIWVRVPHFVQPAAASSGESCGRVPSGTGGSAERVPGRSPVEVPCRSGPLSRPGGGPAHAPKVVPGPSSPAQTPSPDTAELFPSRLPVPAQWRSRVGSRGGRGLLNNCCWSRPGGQIMIMTVPTRPAAAALTSWNSVPSQPPKSSARGPTKICLRQTGAPVTRSGANPAKDKLDNHCALEVSTNIVCLLYFKLHCYRAPTGGQ